MSMRSNNAHNILQCTHHNRVAKNHHYEFFYANKKSKTEGILGLERTQCHPAQWFLQCLPESPRSEYLLSEAVQITYSRHTFEETN